GLFTHALDEGQRFAIRRWLGTHRTTGCRNDGFNFAIAAIEALDRVDQAVRVLVVLEPRPAADILRKVDKVAIRADRRLAEILLVVFLLGQLQTRAARDVVHPQLA